MGDSPLLTKLKQTDKNLAGVYFDITKDDPKVPISKDGVSRLFGMALDKDNTITQKELDALVLIMQNVKFTDEGISFLILVLSNAKVAEALGRGVGTPMTSQSDLAPLFQALALGAKSVNFKSPGSHLMYDGSQYNAISQLLKNNQILAVAVHDHGVVWGNRDKVPPAAAGQGAAAMYDENTDPPTIFLFDGLPELGKLSTLAHEFTHAVQDWNNDASKRSYREADAYIAGGLCFLTETGRPIFDKHPAKPCVDIVKSGQATSSNKNWPQAYEALATIVESDPRNAQALPKNPKGADRQQALSKLLQAAQNAQSNSNANSGGAGQPTGSDTKR